MGFLQVVNKPSISKLDPSTQYAEPKARESLLTPSQTQRLRRASNASVQSSTSVSTLERKHLDEAEMVQRANDAVTMERQRFAIDDVDDEDDDDDFAGGAAGAGGEDDDGVMDEVDAFLQAQGEDSEGLTGKDKELAQCKPVLALFLCLRQKLRAC